MDIRTLLICLFAVLTLQAIALVVAHRSRQIRDGTGWMAVSFGSLALGAGFLALRHLLPPFWTIIASNTLFTLGFILMHRAVIEFRGRGRPYWGLHLTVLGGMLAGMLYFTYGVHDTPMRILIMSAVFSSEAGFISLLLLRSTSRTRVEERLLGGAFAAMTLTNLTRGVLTLIYGSPADYMHGDLIQTLSFVGFIVVCTSIGFFFVWMSSARRHWALHHQATRDPLTGLLNRRGFLSLAPMRMVAAQQEKREVLLLFADIDGLKQVNDTFGHDAGDRVICEAADVLREVLRTSDSVARLHGDEFCALMPVRSFADGDRILQRIEDQVERRNAAAGRDYMLGISAATVAVLPEEARPLEDLLREADQNMYAAKRRRKQQAG